jgi:hypothetical protein
MGATKRSEHIVPASDARFGRQNRIVRAVLNASELLSAATVSSRIKTSPDGAKRVTMARHASERAMPITVDGRVLYRIAEGLREADISRATYFRWVRAGRIADARFRDRNGRRLLTVEELNAIKQHSLEVIDTAVAKPPIKFRARKD